MAKEKTKSNTSAHELRLKIIETRAKIAAGREKNLKAAKNLRRELVRLLSKKEKEVVSEEKK